MAGKSLPDPVTDYKKAVEEAGYLGQVQDPEPNETYTVTGGGKPNAEVVADTLAAAAESQSSSSKDAVATTATPKPGATSSKSSGSTGTSA